jgi:hypothetical protein
MSQWQQQQRQHTFMFEWIHRKILTAQRALKNYYSVVKNGRIIT